MKKKKTWKTDVRNDFIYLFFLGMVSTIVCAKCLLLHCHEHVTCNL